MLCRAAGAAGAASAAHTGGAFGTTRVLRMVPKVYDYPKPRPVIRKTRSWRGLMQVRYDDTRTDRNSILRNALIWAPLRTFGSGVLVAVGMYYYLGHDQFMFMLFGYESEAMVEGRVNANPEKVFADILSSDRGAGSNLRAFEAPDKPTREFDVWAKVAKAPPAMALVDAAKDGRRGVGA